MLPNANGPQPTSKTYSRCCGAARHCCHSCRAQHFDGFIVGVRTNRTYADAAIAHAAFIRVRSIGISVAQEFHQTGQWIRQKRLKSKLTFRYGLTSLAVSRHERFGLWFQRVAATQASNFSTGVWYCKVWPVWLRFHTIYEIALPLRNLS
jgi:hypothetical protein